METDSNTHHGKHIQIGSEAIALKNQYLEACQAERQETIISALDEIAMFNNHEYPSGSVGMERALHSLQDVSNMQMNKRPLPVVLENIAQIPPYSAWAPVSRNYAFETLDEPYMPYFGDRDEDIAASSRAFRMMSDATVEQLAQKSSSDEEVNIRPDDHEFEDDQNEDSSKRGKQRIPRKCYLGAAQLRAASRHAICSLVDKYGSEMYVLEALAKALGMTDASEIEKNLIRVRRKRARKERLKKNLSTSQNCTRQLRAAILYPESHNHSSPTDSTHTVTKTLHNFCYVCNVFCCDLHSRIRLVPQQEIPDLGLSKRLGLLKGEKVNSCSKRCYLLDKWKQSPLDNNEGCLWTEEEVLLLKEALTLFRDDPCRIAVLVGSRSCREVWYRLNVDAKKDRKRILNGVSSQHSMLLSATRRIAAVQNVFGDSSSTGRGNSRRSKQKKRKKVRAENQIDKSVPRTVARKTAVSNHSSDEESAEDISFLPCDHEGPCTNNKQCICVSRRRLCQPSCSCNGVRYTEENGRIVRKGTECSHTQLGCDCKDGECADEDCMCLNVNGAACNPEECSCDCGIPPWLLGAKSRKCKNVGITLGTYKKTFVGRSFVEGFGLFAGEHFAKGDPVGEYLGGQWSRDKADQLLAIGHVMERTYAYDIMNVTVDGKMFGAKVKFINCSLVKDQQNCQPDLIAVNGHYHLLLRTTRDIEPGEEFFFNYGLHGAKSYGWLKEAKRQARLKSPSSSESS